MIKNLEEEILILKKREKGWDFFRKEMNDRLMLELKT